MSGELQTLTTDLFEIVHQVVDVAVLPFFDLMDLHLSSELQVITQLLQPAERCEWRLNGEL